MQIEKLSNGLIMLTLASGLRGLYNADGTYRSGDTMHIKRIRVS